MALRTPDPQQPDEQATDTQWGDGGVFEQYYQNDLQQAEQAATQDTGAGDGGTGAIGEQLGDIGRNLHAAKKKEESPKPAGHSYRPHKSGGPAAAGKLAKGKAKLAALGKGFLKRRGPISLIITIVVSFGSVVGMFFSTPATLFASIKANITNARDTSAPARNMRFTRVISNMMPGGKYGDMADKACEKPKSKMCRALTMSERMLERLEKAGVTVEHDKHEKSGRLKVKLIKLKDKLGREHIATNKQELRALFKKPVFRSVFNRGYDAAKSSFLGKHFKNLLNKRFGINKGPGIDGKDKSELDKSFRKNLQLEGDPDEGDPEKRKNNKEKQTDKVKGKIDVEGIKNASKETTKSAIGIVCAAYHGTKATMAAAKTIQILNLVRFAMAFLTEFDRALATESTPEIANYIGNRLNYSEHNEKDADGKPNRFYNTTFADAEGMRMLLHGDIRNLSEYAQRYVVGGGKIGDVNDIIVKIEEAVGSSLYEYKINDMLAYLTGRSTTSARKTGELVLTELCKAMDAGGSIGDFARCWSTVGSPLTAAGSVVPVIGNLIGAAAGAGICGAIIYALGYLIDYIVGGILEKVVQKVAEWAAEMSLDESTSGFDAGNALATGAGLMLQNSAMSSGLVATDINGYRQYLSNTNEEYSEYIAAHKFDAKGTPLDVTNQYSFLGSLALAMHQSGIDYRGANPIKLLGTSLATIPAATRQLANANHKASALSGIFHTLPPFDDREAKCPDPILTDDFAGDPFCVPYTHMAARGLTVDSADLIKYMEDKEFISKDDGSILTTDNGKILRSFNKFCVSRTLPPGELDPGGSEDGAITNSLESTEAVAPNNGSQPEDYTEDREASDAEGETLLEEWEMHDWQSGFNCTNPNSHINTDAEMLAMLSAYTMDNRIHDDMEEVEEKAVECEIKSEEVVGDSIANGYAKQAGLDDGLTEVGRNPKKIYESIQSKTFESGTHIYLSTGLSNDANDTEHASKTISTLAGQEGVSITLFGIANQFNIGGKTGKELNDWLKQEAEKYPNVTFTGGFDAGSDNVHPTNYDWVPKVDMNCSEANAVGTDDAKKAAQMLLDSPNVNFQIPVQRTYMEQTAADGTQTPTNAGCSGAPVAMSGKMLGMFVEASKHFKFTIGAQAAGHNCDGGFHPQGKALDINGVSRPGEDFQRMVGEGSSPYAPFSQIHFEFYQFLDGVAGKSGMKLELGQSNCGIPGLNAGAVPNSKLVTDACNHLHIGVMSGG